MVRREVAEGHQVGDHSWDHSDLSKLSDSAMEAQLAQTQDVIKKAVGVTPVVLRPPYGSSNHRVAAMARKYKLAQVTWAVDPLDWKVRNAWANADIGNGCSSLVWVYADSLSQQPVNHT